MSADRELFSGSPKSVTTPHLVRKRAVRCSRTSKRGNVGGNARSKWDAHPPPPPQTPVQKQTHETEQTAQVMVDPFWGRPPGGRNGETEWCCLSVDMRGSPFCPPSVGWPSLGRVHPSRPRPCVDMVFLEPAAAVLPPDPGEGNGRNHFNAAAPPSAEFSMTDALCCGDLAGEHGRTVHDLSRINA